MAIGSVFNNLGLRKKMIGAFVIVALFSGGVGLIGIVQIFSLDGMIKQIETKYWVLADTSMHMRIFNEKQRVAVHAHMLGEYEAEQEYFDSQALFNEEYTRLKNTPGVNQTIIDEVEEHYIEFTDLVEGNSTSKSIFNITKDYYIAQDTIEEEMDELEEVHEGIVDLLNSIEYYADEETGHENITVLDAAMELNLDIYEALETLREILESDTLAEVTMYEDEFLEIMDDETNDEDVINEGLVELETYILEADDGSIDQVSATAALAEVKVLVVDGNATFDETFFVMGSEHIPEHKMEEINANILMFNSLEELDEVLDHIDKDLDELEVQCGINMDNSIKQARDNVTVSIGFMFLISIVSLIVAILIGLFSSRMIANPVQMLAKFSDSLAQNDLSKDTSIVDVKREDEIGRLGNSFVVAVDNLREMIKTAQVSAEQVASSAEEMASSSEEVNALSEEIAATIQQISRGSSNQSELSIKAIADVNKMSEVVDKSLRDIEGTLQVIDDIAGQTNILALNAAIEAARAGEYGRGFAVVADNVRRLAEETRNNSTDISTITEGIVTNIGGSVKSLQENLQGFAAQSEEFSASSEEVAAATEEQTAAMHQMTSAAQELTKLGEELSQQVAQFKLHENG